MTTLQATMDAGYGIQGIARNPAIHEECNWGNSYQYIHGYLQGASENVMPGPYHVSLGLGSPCKQLSSPPQCYPQMRSQIMRPTEGNEGFVWPSLLVNRSPDSRSYSHPATTASSLPTSASSQRLIMEPMLINAPSTSQLSPPFREGVSVSRLNKPAASSNTLHWADINSQKVSSASSPEPPSTEDAIQAVATIMNYITSSGSAQSRFSDQDSLTLADLFTKLCFQQAQTNESMVDESPQQDSDMLA